MKRSFIGLFYCCFLFGVKLQAQINIPVPKNQDDALKIVSLDEQSLAYYDGKGLGLMNIQGERISNAVYFSIIPLNEDLYAVQKEASGNFALMNYQGRLQTAYDFVEIGQFQGDLARVTKQAKGEQVKYAVINSQGLIISDWYDSVSNRPVNSYFLIKNQGSWGVFSQVGTHFWQEHFQKVKAFDGQLAPALIKDKWGFVQADGTWVIPPRYIDAQPFEGKYAPVNIAPGQWILINRNGKQITSASYDSIRVYAGGAYSLAWQQGRGIFLNFNGQALNRNRYEQISPFSTSGLAVVRKDSKEVYLNNLAQEIFEADSLMPFNYGRGIFRKGSLWGWINEQGEVIQPPIWDCVIASKNSFLLVQKEGKIFLVDAKGKKVQEVQADPKDIILTNQALIYNLKPTFYLVDLLRSRTQLLDYDEVGDISDGIMAVKKDSLFGYINTTGKEILAPNNFAVSQSTHHLLIARKAFIDAFKVYNSDNKFLYQLDKGLIFIGPFQESKAKVVDAHGYMGFVDENGQIVVPCKYALVGDYVQGRAIFKNTWGKYGFLDEKGQEVIHAQYRFLSNYDESGHAAAIQDEHFGFIDKWGKIVVPFQYDQVYSLQNGVASVSKKGKVGYINMSNKVLIPFTFDEGYQSVDGLALVRMEKYWGYINEKGKVKIPWQFKQAQPFSEGRAWVALDAKYGMIDEKGNYQTSFKYDAVQPFEDGYSKFELGGKWGLIGINRNIVIPPLCDKISSVYDNKVVVSLFSKGYGIRLLSK